MNIALFTDCYLPSKNGVVTVVEQLREGLTKQGHHVVVVTVDVKTDTPETSPYVYRALSIPAGMGTTDQFLGFLFPPKIVRYLKKHKIQLIHVHTEFSIGAEGLRLAKQLHIPVVCTTHTQWEDYYTHYFKFSNLISVNTIRHILRSFYHKSNVVVTVSTKSYKYLKQDFMVPAKTTVVIPNALDPEKFNIARISEAERQSLRHTYGIAEDEILTLFVGRIGEEKRVFEMVESVSDAINKNKKIKAMFIGDGPALKYCQKLTTVFGTTKSIIFTGFLEWSELYRYYQSADIFINASLTETYSITTLEAVLSGLPIVCRRDDSIVDRVIHDFNGYLADTDEEMTDYILKLSQDTAQRQKFKNNTDVIANRHHLDSFIKSHIVLYEKMIHTYPVIPGEAELTECIKKAVE